MPQVYRAIRPMFQKKQWRIFPDDVVQVVTGVEKGATGKVLAVVRDKKQPEVIVEGVNMRKKKIFTGIKPEDYFVVSMEAPLHYSNVMLMDPVSKKPVRTVLRYLPDGTPVRLGLGEDASDQVIPIPKPLEDESKYQLAGPKDTPAAEATRITYNATSAFPFKQPPRPSGLPPAEPQPEDSARGAPQGRRPAPGRPAGPWDLPPLKAAGSKPPRKTLAEHAAAAAGHGICSLAYLGAAVTGGTGCHRSGAASTSSEAS